MAAPSQSLRSRTYYHGTSRENAGEQILKHGIKASDIVMPRKQIKGPNLIPVPGKVYITSDLKYAQIYAIGGDLAGVDYDRSAGKHGYLFEISGEELRDIQPDEDSIGEMIHDELHGHSDSNPFLKNWVQRAQQELTAGQFKKFKDGEYVMYAHLGKKLLKTMSDESKLKFIELGAHVAHTGNLDFKAAWKIDLSKIKELKRDASNFFQIAEKVA